MQIIKLDYTVTVSGGTGSSAVNATGNAVSFSYQIDWIGITAPSAVAAYKIKILDADGQMFFREPYLDSDTLLVGNASVPCERKNRDAVTVQIDGTDGVYVVRLALEKK